MKNFGFSLKNINTKIRSMYKFKCNISSNSFSPNKSPSIRYSINASFRFVFEQVETQYKVAKQRTFFSTD